MKNKIETDEKVNSIVRKIKSIPGVKIVTVNTATNCLQFDVHINGKVGYDDVSDELLHKTIKRALLKRGSIIIRQFTNMIYERLKNGCVVKYKYIYGLSLCDGDVKYLDTKELIEIYDVQDKSIILKRLV